VLQKKEEKQFEQDIKDAVAKYSNDLDRESRDPRLFVESSVTGLLQLQQTKRFLAKDCYFTAKEAKARDPCVVADPTRQTTDSEDDLADS
jgi:hypothetical protein